MQDLLELILLIARLLAAWVALNSHDSIVWLALFAVIPLAFAGAVVVLSLPFIVVTPGEAVSLQLLLTSPSLHHVVKLYNHLGAVVGEVAVDVLHSEAILEAVDDVLNGDIGAGVEEASCVTSRSCCAPACTWISHVEWLPYAWSLGNCR